jgi:outer membrane protein OmpA-like peptidoglycan-associated protein
MVVGSGRSRGWDGRALALGLAMACVFGLDGCSSYNPFTLYRDLTGASKDDPPKDAANTANLEAGSQEPYPAAGAVPNPPTRGLTESQREKLAQGLVADRANAHYVDEQVTAGNGAAVMAPQAPVPDEQLPIAIPAEAPAAAPAAPTPAPPRSAGNFVTGGFSGHSGEIIPKAGTPTAPPAPVAADRESALQTPAPRALPAMETPQPPQPPPEMKPLPPPQPPQPFPGAPALPPQPPAEPAQVAGIPVPPPPPSREPAVANPPNVPAAPAVASALNLPAGKRAKSAQIAEVAFVAGATALNPEAPDKLKDVPALHQQYGGIVRVVGYASLPEQGGADPSGQQLAAYQAALQRAQLVKQALVTAGVPAADIITEASPIHGSGPAADRADIYDEY